MRSTEDMTASKIFELAPSLRTSSLEDSSAEDGESALGVWEDDDDDGDEGDTGLSRDTNDGSELCAGLLMDGGLAALSSSSSKDFPLLK